MKTCMISASPWLDVRNLRIAQERLRVTQATAKSTLRAYLADSSMAKHGPVATVPKLEDSSQNIALEMTNPSWLQARTKLALLSRLEVKSHVQALCGV